MCTDVLNCNTFCADRRECQAYKNYLSKVKERRVEDEMAYAECQKQKEQEEG